jgi:hypothetical protein
MVQEEVEVSLLHLHLKVVISCISPTVIGEMRWNPQLRRWDGNEQALRDFDGFTGNSARPALITHLTAACISGNLALGITPGMRVVGNMIFDPEKMCWLPKEPSNEPDPFAGIDDDEDLHTAELSYSLPSSSGSSTEQSSISESEGEANLLDTPLNFPLRSSNPAFKESCMLSEITHHKDMSGWVVSQACLQSRLHYIRELATKSY